MRIIAIVTDDTIGLIEEYEVVGANEKLMEVLVNLGMAKVYDDTKPLPPKGLNNYESGMEYPSERFIIKNDSLYQSNTQTSLLWVDTEWDIKITGVNKQ